MTDKEKIDLLIERFKIILSYSSPDEDGIFCNKWDIIALLEQVGK
jgi:hypothetical protein